MANRGVQSTSASTDNKIEKVNTAAIRIVVFAVAILAIVFAIIQFNFSNDERITQLNASQVKDNTEKLAKEVDNLISDRLASIKILSEFYGQSLKNSDNPDVNVDIGMLQQMTNDSNFDFMEFADAEGWDHTITGNKTDATDRVYWKEGMKGNTGLELIFKSRATYETLLMFYSPVKVKDNPDDPGETVGVMLGVVQATGKIAEIIDVSYYDEKAEVFLCDSNGDIVASSLPLDKLDTTNQIAVTDVLKDEDTVAKIKLTMSSKPGTANVFENGRTHDSIGCVTKLKSLESGWLLVEVFPNAVHNDLVGQSRKISARLQIILLAVFVLVIFTIVITNIIDRKKLIKKETEQKAALQRHLSIIQSMGQIYFASYYVDLEKDMSVDLSGMKEYREESGSLISVRKNIKNAVDNLIQPEFADVMREFLNLDTVDDRLKEKQVITCDFKGVSGNWNQVHLIAGDRDASGKLNHIFFAFRTINDEKAKEAAAQAKIDEQVQELKQANDQKEEHLEVIEGLGSEYFSILLVDNVKDTVTPYRTQGEEGKIISEFFINGGYKWSALILEYTEYMVLEEDRADFLASFDFKYDKDYSFNYRMVKGDDTAWLQVKIAFVERKDGTKIAVIGTKNVDEVVKEEQKKQKALADALDAAERANRSKSDFLFNMSHDIRTPMNAIIGYTDLLKKNIDNTELRDRYIENIQTSNGYLLDLINNVLDTARIESGKATLEEAPSDIWQLGKNLDTTFAGAIAKKNLKYTVHDSTVHRYVYLDPTKFAQIMFNIVSNAVKYTPEGGSIDIYCHETPSEREGWSNFTTVVKDTGIGISKQFLPHIFESFSREKTVTDSKIVGTGLGMGIVKRLIELMNGVINVESELGKGTTVTFTIPHRIADDAAPKNEDSEVVVDSTTFAGKRILLAEDNELNAEISIEILSEAGFEVERAEDGIVCVDMLNKHESGYYDVVLMDVQMPNMDGIKATTVIRLLTDKTKASVPIVAMTANAFEEDRKKCLDAGMNGFVSKPIDIDKLIGTLLEILK